MWSQQEMRFAELQICSGDNTHRSLQYPDATLVRANSVLHLEEAEISGQELDKEAFFLLRKRPLWSSASLTGNILYLVNFLFEIMDGRKQPRDMGGHQISWQRAQHMHPYKNAATPIYRNKMTGI